MAQHDLLDNDLGHERWSALDVLRLKVDEVGGRVFAREVTLADVVSLHPWDKLGWQPSWFLRFGAEAPREFACEKCMTASFNGALGTSWRFYDERLVLGTFAATRATGLNPYHEGPWAAGGVRVLAGVAGERWKLLTTVERLWSFSEGDLPWSLELAASWSLGSDWSLRLFTTEQLVEKQVRSLGSGLSLLYYF
jgi:hypothetical protein